MGERLKGPGTRYYFLKYITSLWLHVFGSNDGDIFGIPDWWVFIEVFQGDTKEVITIIMSWAYIGLVVRECKDFCGPVIFLKYRGQFNRRSHHNTSKAITRWKMGCLGEEECSSWGSISGSWSQRGNAVAKSQKIKRRLWSILWIWGPIWL